MPKQTEDNIAFPYTDMITISNSSAVERLLNFKHWISANRLTISESMSEAIYFLLTSVAQKNQSIYLTHERKQVTRFDLTHTVLDDGYGKLLDTLRSNINPIYLPGD